MDGTIDANANRNDYQQVGDKHGDANGDIHPQFERNGLTDRDTSQHDDTRTNGNADGGADGDANRDSHGDADARPYEHADHRANGNAHRGRSSKRAAIDDGDRRTLGNPDHTIPKRDHHALGYPDEHICADCDTVAERDGDAHADQNDDADGVACCVVCVLTAKCG